MVINFGLRRGLTSFAFSGNLLFPYREHYFSCPTVLVGLLPYISVWRKKFTHLEEGSYE